MDDTSFDCIVIGAGPAGRDAGNLLARYRRRVLVIDGNTGRAPWLPPVAPASIKLASTTPDPAPAPTKSQRAKAAVSKSGDTKRAPKKSDVVADVTPAMVSGVEFVDGGFGVTTLGGAYRARTILLATDIRMRRPDMPDAAHDRAVGAGLLHYPGDTVDLAGKDVAVLGDAEHGPPEAMRLRGLGVKTTLLLTPDAGLLDAATVALLRAADVTVPAASARIGELGDGRIGFCLDDGRLLYFDTCLVALGQHVPASGLATMLGCRIADDGGIVADARRATSVAGVFSAAGGGGDPARVAASAIHGFLKG